MEKKKPPIIVIEDSNPSEFKDDSQKSFASEYLLSPSLYGYDNSSATTPNDVFFIDGGLDDIDGLISSLPADATFFVLDPFQNGIEQMAEILSCYVNLNAIHVLSHGAAGSLSLGSTILDQSSLEQYSNQLTTIGKALAGAGDLLLYGCNVAQGEIGQAFIEKLATITGADVAASTDLTGAVNKGGDWELENSEGMVETAAITLSDSAYDHTLNLVNTTLNFSALDQNLLWGQNGETSRTNTWDGLLWHYDPGILAGEIDLIDQNFLLPDLDLAYAVDFNEIELGLLVDFTLNSGLYDLSYPVTAQLVLPNQVKAGDDFSVSTGVASVNNPSLNVDGPELEITPSLRAAGTLDGYMELQSGDEVLYRKDVDQVNLGGELDLFTLSSLDPPIQTGDQITSWLETYGGSVSFPSGNFSIGPFASVGYNYVSSADGSTDNIGSVIGSLPDLKLRLTQDDPLMWAAMDLDDTLGVLLGATTGVGGALVALDFDATDVSLPYLGCSLGLVSADITFGFKPYLDITYDVQNIQMTLESSAGEVHSGLLGDTFTFVMPDDQSGPLTLDATYQLLGYVGLEFGLQLEGGIEVSILSASFASPIVTADFSVFDFTVPSDPDGSLGDIWPFDLYSSSWASTLESLTSSYSISVGASTIDGEEPDTPPSLRVSLVGGVAIEEGNVGAKTINLQITREGNLDQATSATYNFVWGSGLNAADFIGGLPVNGSLAFAAGESGKTISFTIAADTINEEDERFSFILKSSQASVLTPSTTITIQDDDRNNYAGSGFILASPGDDVIHGSSGTDTIYGGGGNDSIDSGLGDGDLVDGGTGNDTLHIDYSTITGSFSFKITNSNNEITEFLAGNSFDEISTALQGAVKFGFFLRGTNDRITYSNIENVNIATSKTAGYSYFGFSDLLVKQGTGTYDGGLNSDTFYADLASWTDAVIWDNSDPTQMITLADGTEVVNMERLLLATGSGADVIKNTNSSNTNDYFDLGAGNDSVEAGGGNDTILGGVGRDNLAGGSGNDIYRYSTKDDSTVASYDTITDFAIGDSIEFTGMADMRLLTGAFQWQGTLQTTLTAIQNDNYLANSLVFFNDGTDGWLYVRGAGMGTDFESSLIKLQGRAVTLGASDISGESGTFSRPVLSVSAASANLLEGNAGACTSFTFTVSRSGDLNGTSSATWSLAGSGTNPANAADLFGGNLSGGTVSFAVGESSKTVTVDIAGDDVIEPDETFALTLSNPTGATLGTASATGTIRNDDCTLAIAAGSASKSEGNGTGSTSFTFTVTRGGYANTTTSVNWSVAGSGAQPGNAADFTGGIMPGGTLNFAAGTTSKTITVNIARDDKTEADETFAVILSDAVGSTIIVGSATGTILTDDNTMRIGTAKAEILTGTADDDALCGLAGNDTLNGLAGNDLLDGGQGADRLAGGLDNDTYVVDNLGDVVTENTNSGLDVVEASTSAILAANVENLILTGSGNINGTGNTMGNVLTGNSGSNILDGKSGLDTFVGGMGDDTYLLDQEGELASITENAAEGTDLLKIGYGNSSTILAKSISLAGNLANIDQVALMGTGLFNIIGNNLDNVLTGNASVNALEGGAGNDILDGKAGKDTLIGGMGNDIYVIDNIGDIITENDGEGIDTVQAGLTWTLGNNLDNLTLTGALAINCTGNGMNNALIGNKAANRLDGGLGADTLIGGLGNDTYMVDDGGDTITETSVLASEIDTVLAKIDWTLGNNLENLVLTGSNSINGTGNTLKNTLTGNTAANCLDGGLGADKMLGGAGDDIYIVDNPGDFVTETTNSGLDTVEASISYTLGANVENLLLTGFGNINGTGNTQSNVLTGNDGNNILDGKTGLDTFVGGIGNDTYVLNLEGELATITENAGEGTDMLKIGYGNSLTTVAKVISLTDNLVNIEHVTLLGAGLFNIAGNDLDNALTGNASINSLLGGSGNDTLDGKGGKDNLIGGEGNDTYVIDNTGDLITENAGEGTDTVRTTLTSNLGDNLENLTLIGISAINGTGNGLDNILTGNNAANRLDGGIGNDTLSGGLGNDILTGGEGQDSFLFNTSLNRTTNKDSIVDYTVTDDTIVLDNSIFKKLSESGTLSEDNFRGSNNGAASDATDYILYNTTTGALFYDSDGSGVATAIQFASLTSKPTLSANEFLVV